jgi:hypothetical protein
MIVDRMQHSTVVLNGKHGEKTVKGEVKRSAKTRVITRDGLLL